jgi:hypothetical protein
MPRIRGSTCTTNWAAIGGAETRSSGEISGEGLQPTNPSQIQRMLKV